MITSADSSACNQDPYDLFILGQCYVITTYYPKEMNAESYDSCKVTTQAIYIGKHQGKFLFSCRIGGSLISFTDAQLYGEQFLKIEDSCDQDKIPQFSQILK